MCEMCDDQMRNDTGEPFASDEIEAARDLLDAGYDDGFGVTSLDTLLSEQMGRARRLDFAAFILREARSKQAQGEREDGGAR